MHYHYSSEPSPCLEDEELEKQQKQDSNAVEMVATEQPLEPPFLTAIQGVHSSPSSRTSTQGFHSSVTEDNLDLSNRAQSDVNTNLVSSPSHKASSHKDLTLDQFSGTGMTNSDNDTYKYHNSKQLNVLSVSDKVLNLPLKNDDELQEYQLTVNGKRKGSFTDDPDKSDSDNEKVLSESDSERNIQLCSSRNDSYNLSKDTDLFGDGPKTAGDLNKQDSNNKKVLGDSDAKRNVDVDSSGYDTNILIEDTDVESSGYNSNILTEDTDLCEDGPQTFGKQEGDF